MITGNTLIQMGFKPGKWFKNAIEHINENKLYECNDHLELYLSSVCPAPCLELHEKPIKYHVNIEANSQEESDNVKSVFDTMDVLMRTPTIIDGCVMPDACSTGKIGQIPVGGVAVAKNAIHPSFHSADICCSVMLTSFGSANPFEVLNRASEITHFGPGGRKDLFVLPKELEEKIRGNYFLNTERSLHLAKTHLGTQGDGNHFLFVGTSKNTGHTCMVTHHGSRGFGANLYKSGMAVAERFRRELSPATPTNNAWIPYDTNEGKTYWEALQIVREWTKLNHDVLHDSIFKAVYTEDDKRVGGFWNEHNFVFKDGENFYHAKGATPLSDKFVHDNKTGLRIIPLNMAQPVLIVSGERNANNLGFAPHGAGRNIGRKQHIRNKAGKSFDEILKEETAGLDIRFYSGTPDISELPSAYKDAEAVRGQMEKFGLGVVVDEIQPYGCIMAGDCEVNAPWRVKKELKKQAI